jgi:hypothetical protein
MRRLMRASRVMTAPPSPVVMCFTGWKLKTVASELPAPIFLPRYSAPIA